MYHSTVKPEAVLCALRPEQRRIVTRLGQVYTEKPGAAHAYRERLEALASRHPIRCATTDEIMPELRGDPADDYKKRS